jgi:uridine kinase
VDNYFVNREDTPLDEFGQLDYECLGAIDVDLLNQNLTDLLAGLEVELPVFNFKTGKRETGGGSRLKLGEDDILVLEGIHCLNDALTCDLPKKNKFKIYISALTQLNVDEHNPITTTDGRLIRRIVRDARTRGTTAQKTIAMWPSVRRGEEKNIFPYQEDADVMFNSALIYELSVLKSYAEPLLFGIDKNAPEYVEAKRILKFLDYFVGVGSEKIPMNSLLREFIGGGCFNL